MPFADEVGAVPVVAQHFTKQGVGWINPKRVTIIGCGEIVKCLVGRATSEQSGPAGRTNRRVISAADTSAGEAGAAANEIVEHWGGRTVDPVAVKRLGSVIVGNNQ